MNANTVIRLRDRGNGMFLGEIEMPFANGGAITVGALAIGDSIEDTMRELGYDELGWGWSSIKNAAKKVGRAAKKVGGRVKAIKKVATIAKRVLDDPIVKGLLPSQVTGAINAAKKLAAMAQKKGSKYMKKIAPHLPAAQKALAKALAKDGIPPPPPPEQAAAPAAPVVMPASQDLQPAEAYEDPDPYEEEVDVYGDQPADDYQPEATEEGDQVFEAYEGADADQAYGEQ